MDLVWAEGLTPPFTFTKEIKETVVEAIENSAKWGADNITYIPAGTGWVLVSMQPAIGKVIEALVYCPDHFKLKETVAAIYPDHKLLNNWRYLKNGK